MATLAQRTQTVEERTDRLESILATFMERTDRALERTDNSIERLERAIERMEQEGARDREESADIVAPSIQRLTREVFDCGERQYFGTRVSLTRSVDRSRERGVRRTLRGHPRRAAQRDQVLAPHDMVTWLTRRGIYAIAMGDEAMQVLNLDAVRSRTAAP